MESMSYNSQQRSYGAIENGIRAGYGYGSREMRVGDRVFARVTLERKVVLEITCLNVGSMTDLVGELRYAMRGRSGLANVYIRNHSRGWSCERPMRFYADGSARPDRRHLRASTAVTAPEIPARRMLFPWETH